MAETPLNGNVPNNSLESNYRMVYPADLSSDRMLKYGQDTVQSRMDLVNRSNKYEVTSYDVRFGNEFTDQVFTNPNFTLYGSNRSTSENNAYAYGNYAKAARWGAAKGTLVELPTEPFGRQMHIKAAIAELKTGETVGFVGTANATDSGLGEGSRAQFNYGVEFSDKELVSQLRTVMNQIATGESPTSTKNFIVQSPKDPDAGLAAVVGFINNEKNHSDLYISSASLTNKDVIGALVAKAGRGEDVYVGFGGLSQDDDWRSQGAYEMLMSDPETAKHIHAGMRRGGRHENMIAMGDEAIVGSMRFSKSTLDGVMDRETGKRTHGTELLLYAKNKHLAKDVQNKIAEGYDYKATEAWANRFESKYSWLANQFMPLNSATGRTKYLIDPTVPTFAKEYAIESGTIDRFEQSASLGTSIYASLFNETYNRLPTAGEMPEEVKAFDRLAAKRTWGQESFGLEKVPVIGDLIKNWGGLRQLGTRGPIDSMLIRGAMWADDHVFTSALRERNPYTGEYQKETPMQALARFTYDSTSGIVGNIAGYYWVTLPGLRVMIHARSAIQDQLNTWAAKERSPGVGRAAKFLFGRNYDLIGHRIAGEVTGTVLKPVAQMLEPILGFTRGINEIEQMYLNGGDWDDDVKARGSAPARLQTEISHPQGKERAFRIADRTLANHPLLRAVSGMGIARYFAEYSPYMLYKTAMDGIDVVKAGLDVYRTEGTHSTELRKAMRDVTTGKVLNKFSFGLLGQDIYQRGYEVWDKIYGENSKAVGKTSARGPAVNRFGRPTGNAKKGYTLKSGKLEFAGRTITVNTANVLLDDKMTRVHQSINSATADFDTRWNKALGIDNQLKKAVQNTDGMWARKALAVAIPLIFLNKWAGDVGAASRVDVAAQAAFRDRVNDLNSVKGFRRDIDINWTGGISDWGGLGILNPITLPLQAMAYKFDQLKASWYNYTTTSKALDKVQVASGGVYGQAALQLAGMAIANPGKVYTGTGNDSAAMKQRAAQFAASGNYSLANSLLLESRLGPGANTQAFSTRNGLSLALQIDAVPLLFTPTAAVSFMGDQGVFSFSLQGPVMFPVGFTIGSPLGLKKHDGAPEDAHLGFLKGMGLLEHISGYNVDYVSGTSGEKLFRLGMTAYGAASVARALTMDYEFRGKTYDNKLKFLKEMNTYKTLSNANKVIKFASATAPMSLVNLGLAGLNLAGDAWHYVNLQETGGFSRDAVNNILRHSDKDLRAQTIKEEIWHAKAGKVDVKIGSHLDSVLERIATEERRLGVTGLPNNHQFYNDLVQDEYKHLLKGKYSDRFWNGRLSQGIALAGGVLAGAYFLADLGLSMYGQAFASGPGGSADWYKRINEGIMRTTGALSEGIDNTVGKLPGVFGLPGHTAAAAVNVIGGLFASLFDVGYSTAMSKDMMAIAAFKKRIGDREGFEEYSGDMNGYFIRMGNRFKDAFAGTYGGVAPRFLGTSNLGAVFGQVGLDSTTFSKVYVQGGILGITGTVATGAINTQEDTNTSRMMAAYIERAFVDPGRDERTSNRRKSGVIGEMFHNESGTRSQSGIVQMQIRNRTQMTNWILSTDTVDVARHFFMPTEQSNKGAGLLDGLKAILGPNVDRRVKQWGTGIADFGYMFGSSKSKSFFELFESTRDYATQTGELGELDFFAHDYQGESNRIAFDNPKGMSPEDFHREVFQTNPAAKAGLVIGTLGTIGIGILAARNVLRGKGVGQIKPDMIGDVLGESGRAARIGVVGISPTGSHAMQSTSAFKPGSKPFTGAQVAGKFYDRYAFVIGSGTNQGLYSFGLFGNIEDEYGNPYMQKGRVMGAVNHRTFKETLVQAKTLAGGKGVKDLAVSLELMRETKGINIAGHQFPKLAVAEKLEKLVSQIDDLDDALRTQRKMLQTSLQDIKELTTKGKLMADGTRQALDTTEQAVMARRRDTRKVAMRGTDHLLANLNYKTDLTDFVQDLRGGRGAAWTGSKVQVDGRKALTQMSDELSKRLTAAQKGGRLLATQRVDLTREFLEEAYLHNGKAIDVGGRNLTKGEVLGRLSAVVDSVTNAAYTESEVVKNFAMSALKEGRIQQYAGKTMLRRNAREGMQITLGQLLRGELKDYINSSWEQMREVAIEKNRQGYIKSLALAYEKTHGGIVGAGSTDLLTELHQHLAKKALAGEQVADDMLHTVFSTMMNAKGEAARLSPAGESAFLAEQARLYAKYDMAGTGGLTTRGALALAADTALGKTVGGAFWAAKGAAVHGVALAPIMGNMASIYSLGQAANDTNPYRLEDAQRGGEGLKYMAKVPMNIAFTSMLLAGHNANKAAGLTYGAAFKSAKVARQSFSTAVAGMRFTRAMWAVGALAIAGTGGAAMLPVVGGLLATELVFAGLQYFTPMDEMIDKWAEENKEGIAHTASLPVISQMLQAGGHIFRALQAANDYTFGNLAGWSRDPNKAGWQQALGSGFDIVHNILSVIPEWHPANESYKPFKGGPSPSVTDRVLARSPIWYGSYEDFFGVQHGRQERMMMGNPTSLIYDWFHESSFGGSSVASNFNSGRHAGGDTADMMRGPSLFSEPVMTILKSRAIDTQFLMAGLSDRSLAYGGSDKDVRSVDSGYFKDPYIVAKGSMTFWSKGWGENFIEGVQSKLVEGFSGSSVNYDMLPSAKNLKQWEPLIQKAAKQFNLDANVMRAVMMQESGGDKKATSWAGAGGLMQFTPETFAMFKAKYPHLIKGDRYDPESSLMASAAYLSDLNRQFKGDIKLIAAGYNAGTGNARKALLQTRAEAEAAVIRSKKGPRPIEMKDTWWGQTQPYAKIIESNFKKLQEASGALVTPSLDKLTITSRHGVRKHPVTGKVSKHEGTDFNAPPGTRQYAVTAGTVLQVGWNDAGGQIVSYGWTDPQGKEHVIKLMHNSTVHVKAGDKVKAGTLLASSGASGKVSGAHIHIEHWVDKVDQGLEEDSDIARRTVGMDFGPIPAHNHDHDHKPKAKPKPKKKVVAAQEKPKTVRVDNKTKPLPKRTNVKVSVKDGMPPTFSLGWFEGQEFGAAMDNNYRPYCGPVRIDNWG
jgi:murein DD-endopeptidase MepM/ murein hydrolase activator NlpD